MNKHQREKIIIIITDIAELFGNLIVKVLSTYIKVSESGTRASPIRNGSGTRLRDS